MFWWVFENENDILNHWPKYSITCYTKILAVVCIFKIIRSVIRDKGAFCASKNTKFVPYSNETTADDNKTLSVYVMGVHAVKKMSIFHSKNQTIFFFHGDYFFIEAVLIPNLNKIVIPYLRWFHDTLVKEIVRCRWHYGSFKKNVGPNPFSSIWVWLFCYVM